MITLKYVKHQNFYTTAKYIIFVDVDGLLIVNGEQLENAWFLNWEKTDNGGIKIKLEVYNSMPFGWHILPGAQTAPRGFAWIYNGKSTFCADRKIAFIRL